MATGHMFTNRGRLLIAQGAWDDVGGTVIGVGLVKVQGAAGDTQAEIDDMNTVTDLITTAGCTECDFTNYARKNDAHQLGRGRHQQPGQRCRCAAHVDRCRWCVEQHGAGCVLLRQDHRHQRRHPPADFGRLVRRRCRHERWRLGV